MSYIITLAGRDTRIDIFLKFAIADVSEPPKSLHLTVNRRSYGNEHST